MSRTPIEKQLLARDRIEDVKTNVRRQALSGHDLLLAIEQSQGRQLPEELRDRIREFSAPAVKRRGRPPKCKGRLDFALEKLDRRYPALLRYEERKWKRLLQGRGARLRGETPSELAYTRLLHHMKDDFGNIDWLALRNLHSKWKHGHFHSAENHVDSEDFDTEIERQFPSPTRPS